MNMRKLNRGTTLVELIATFALLSLFMVAATKVISNTIIVYHEAKGVQVGMQLTNILTSKIAGEVESAVATGYVKKGENGSSDAAIYISDNGNKIDLLDKTGEHIYITAKDGYMLIYYFPIVDSEDELTNEEMLTKGQNWTYDDSTYMGYTISKLRFSKAGNEYENNILCMELTLHSPKYGDYSSKKYIKCYNFNTDALVSKIVVE